MTGFLGTLFVLILGWFGFLSTAEAAIAVPVRLSFLPTRTTDTTTVLS
jgi:hypothetical protein